MKDNWADEILTFWFSELGPKDWWAGGPHIDDAVRTRFLELHEQLAAKVPDNAWSDPKAALAAIIALDQFPRNMFRKTGRAFATDPIALRLSKNAVEKGLDAGLGKEERQFLYMPHVHSETIEDQDECVRLFSLLGDDESVQHAEDHRVIIQRFGRFPHRNQALGRESTPEEVEFAAGHSGFGQ